MFPATGEASANDRLGSPRSRPTIRAVWNAQRGAPGIHSRFISEGAFDFECDTQFIERTDLEKERCPTRSRRLAPPHWRSRLSPPTRRSTRQPLPRSPTRARYPQGDKLPHSHISSRPGSIQAWRGSGARQDQAGVGEGPPPRFSLILPDNRRKTGRIGGLRTGFCRKINLNNNRLGKVWRWAVTPKPSVRRRGRG